MSSACVCHTEAACFYCNVYVPLEEKAEEQAAEIERLTDLRLRRMEIEDGSVNFHISGEAGMAFATILVKFFEDNGGKNFFSFDLKSDQCHYSINIQKVGGELSLTEMMNEQAAEIERLKGYLRSLRTSTPYGLYQDQITEVLQDGWERGACE